MLKVLHRDHGLTVDHLDHLEVALGGREDGFFIDVLPIPSELPALPAALYGPREGDAPVVEEEVHYQTRGNRPTTSRLVARPERQGRFVVVIGIRAVGDTTLFTAYGSVKGVVAEREWGDPSLDSWEAIQEARKFWLEEGHALAG